MLNAKQMFIVFAICTGVLLALRAPVAISIGVGPGSGEPPGTQCGDKVSQLQENPWSGPIRVASSVACESGNCAIVAAGADLTQFGNLTCLLDITGVIIELDPEFEFTDIRSNHINGVCDNLGAGRATGTCTAIADGCETFQVIGAGHQGAFSGNPAEFDMDVNVRCVVGGPSGVTPGEPPGKPE